MTREVIERGLHHAVENIERFLNGVPADVVVGPDRGAATGPPRQVGVS